MLIYEPKNYPSLNPKIGSIVYECLTGKELGEVYKLINDKFLYHKYNSTSTISCISHISGFQYYLANTFCKDDITHHRGNIIMYYHIGENKRIKC